MLIRLISLLSASAYMQLSTGRSSSEVDQQSKRAFELELIDAEGIDSRSLQWMMSTDDKVELLFHWVQQLIVDNIQKNVFTVQPPILSRCFQELGNAMVSYRHALKIANIPVPFPWVQATEMLLVSHWCLCPFLMCFWIVSPFWTGVLTFVQVSFYWSLNAIAAELENPFGEDVNDLPAQEMQQDLNKHLLLIIHPTTRTPARLSEKAACGELREDDDPQKMLFGRLVSDGSVCANIGSFTSIRACCRSPLQMQNSSTSLGNLTARVTGADDFKEQRELLLSPQTTRMKIPTSHDLSANGYLKDSAGTSREDHVGDTGATVADAERKEPGAGHRRQPPVQAEILRETAVPAASPMPPATGQETSEKQQSKEKLFWQVERSPALGSKEISVPNNRCPNQNWDGWRGHANTEQQAFGNATRTGNSASQRLPGEDPSPAQFLSELVSLGKEVRDHMRVMLRATELGTTRNVGHALVVPEALPLRAITVDRHNL